MTPAELQTRATPDDIGERVPKDLIELDQWVLWRPESVRDRVAKVPYAAAGRRASSTDPRTWCSFEAAVRAWGHHLRYYAGLGFVFRRSDGLVGIDLDDCLTAGGEVKPWACGVVGRLCDTYCEVSPSGLGLKLWARGTLPNNLPSVKVSDGAIELYCEKRFFVVTGLAFRGAPLQVEDYATDLKLLFDHLSMRTPRKLWPLQPQNDGRIPHGQQHSTLISIAGTLRARRVVEPAILACLMAINDHQCERPGPPENIARIVRSTRSWGPR
jgi:hypothetical protein